MNQEANNNPLPAYSDYLNCLVAFVDILGFDANVRRISSEKDFLVSAGPLCVIREISRQLAKKDTLLRNLQMTAVSDSLILTIPHNDPSPAAMSMVVLLHMIQYQLLHGFRTLLRGYMTRGEVYHKDNLLFGKGYSDSYLGEQTIGHFPRIVIAPFLVEEAKSNIAKAKVKYVDHMLNYIVPDNDNLYFIDYLKPNGALSVLTRSELLDQRNEIAKIIQQNISTYASDNGVLPKYQWLNTYFDSSRCHYSI